MRNYFRSIALRVSVTVAVLLAALPVAVLGGQTASAAPADQPSATVSSTLTVQGGWIAYSFYYPGDNSEVNLALTYSPADQISDQTVNFNLYAPTALPPNGAPMASGAQGAVPGSKNYQFQSTTAGMYEVLIQTWDTLNRPINIVLNSVSVANSVGVPTGGPGPLLSFVSSGPSASASTAPSPTLATQPLFNQGQATVNGNLTVQGGWIAYTFNYAGDNSEINLALSYNPADQITDQTMNFNLYGPAAPPPGGVPMAAGAQGSQPGLKNYQFQSTTPGTYVVLVQDWDPLARPMSFTLSSTNETTGGVGPALNPISQGP